MYKINPLKQKLLDERNKEIYDMYNNPENPLSLSDISKKMTFKGQPITRQGVWKVIRKMQNQADEMPT